MRVAIRLHLRRRGALLLLLALLYLYVGAGLWMQPGEVDDALFHTHLPLWVRVGLWLVPAVVASVFAFKERDRWGWMVLVLPVVLRICSFIGAWVFWLVPGGVEGHADGLWRSLLYVFILGVILLGSGWPEPPPDDMLHHREGPADGRG
jgi:hypothetical protein